MVEDSCSMVRQELGAWMVPTSSVDSSGLVPMKSKPRHRTVRDRAWMPSISSCVWLATGWDDMDFGLVFDYDLMCVFVFVFVWYGFLF